MTTLQNIAGLFLWRPLRAALAPVLAASVLFAAEPVRSFDLPADAAEKSLKRFSEQSGVQVLFPTKLARGVTTRPVKGEMTPRQALERMLANSGLTVIQNDQTGAYAIRREEGTETKNGESRPSPGRAADSYADKQLELPVFEVMGSKLLNMDLPRSPDDPLPYVIFARERIEQSGAINLEDFLKQRLTMNTMESTFADSQGSTFGTRSQINLRGLGTGQTLILIDGHRTAGSSYGVATGPAQPDLSGIPLSAVERIEVLPATASSIYGGGATGGVINIILRRDYAGAELKFTYNNTFDTDSAVRRVQFNGGFNLEGGKTNVLLTGSFSDAHTLALRDRNFVLENRARVLANNPANFLNATNPPLGSTPNIRSVNGSPLFGNGTSYFTFVPLGYAGSSSLADVRTALQANAGRYNFDLADSVQANGGGGTPFYGVPETISLMMTVRRQFTERLQAFLELSGSNVISVFPVSRLASYTLAANAPNNPFGQAVRVTVPGTTGDSARRSDNFERRAVAGLLFKVGRDWTLEADYTWNRSRTDSEEGPRLTGAEAASIQNGTINVLRDTQAFPIDLTSFLAFSPAFTDPFRFTLKDATIRAAGPLFTLPGGPINLSGLVEHREETIDRALEQSLAGAPLTYPERKQTVASGYLECRVPLFSERNARPFLRQLDLHLSARWDRYTTESASTTAATEATILRSKTRLDSANPTIALSYRPIQDVMLRGSYGTGFLPPTVYQLVTNPNPLGVNTTVIDPKRGNTSSSVPVVGSGGNPGLVPEESESISAGVVLTPKLAPGLRVSLDYVRTKKTDEIVQVTGQDAVNVEDLFPGILTRGAVPAGDPFGVGPITSVSAKVQNLSRTEVESYDAAVGYTWDKSRYGSIEFFAQSTWLVHLRRQVHPQAPITENAGKNLSSVALPKFKATAGFIWQRGPWSAGWSTRFVDGFEFTNATQILNQGADTISDQTYHDLFAGYRSRSASVGRGRWARLLAGTELQVGVKNVLNTEPAFDVSGATQAFYSRFGSPQMATYWLTVTKRFD